MDVRAIQILLNFVKDKRREIYNIDVVLRWGGPFLLGCLREDFQDDTLVELKDREALIPILIAQRGKCQSELNTLEEELRKAVGVTEVSKEGELNAS